MNNINNDRILSNNVGTIGGYKGGRTENTQEKKGISMSDAYLQAKDIFGKNIGYGEFLKKNNLDVKAENINYLKNTKDKLDNIVKNGGDATINSLAKEGYDIGKLGIDVLSDFVSEYNKIEQTEKSDDEKDDEIEKLIGDDMNSEENRNAIKAAMARAGIVISER
ncbi:MAG: hypothetical protein IJ583_02025, partial [Firmicutes bacterium]|nr:hypothetical protein [Bacillota bacterium]